MHCTVLCVFCVTVCLHSFPVYPGVMAKRSRRIPKRSGPQSPSRRNMSPKVHVCVCMNMNKRVYVITYLGLSFLNLGSSGVSL